MNLIEQSKQWHNEAEDLIANSKLLEILKSFGEVYFTGSYKYDLMLGPDIDFLLVCQDPETAAQNLINKLIKQRYWNGYKFYDWEHFDMPKHPDYPKAYYVGTKVTYNEHRWKTDIWIVNKFPSNIDNSWIEEKAKGDKKLKILEFKKERDDNNSSVSSYDIYDAVINKNIKSFEDLKKQY